MRHKPIAVRLAGWIFVGLFGLGVWMLFHSGGRPLTGRELAGCAGYLVSVFGFAVVWLGGTVKAKMDGRLRGVHRKETPDLADFRRLAGAAGPRLHMNEPYGPVATEATDCARCSRPVGVLICVPHAATLCWPCMLVHDEAGVCYYFPVQGRMVQSSSERAAGRSANG